MRIGFICDVIVSQRSPTSVTRAPLTSFLTPPITDVILAPPGDNDDAYAGLAEVTAEQVTALRALAQTLGAKLVLFELTGRTDARGLADDLTDIDSFLQELGLSSRGQEGRGDTLARVWQRVAGSTLDHGLTQLSRKQLRGLIS